MRWRPTLHDKLCFYNRVIRLAPLARTVNVDDNKWKSQVNYASDTWFEYNAVLIILLRINNKFPWTPYHYLESEFTFKTKIEMESVCESGNEKYLSLIRQAPKEIDVENIFCNFSRSLSIWPGVDVIFFPPSAFYLLWRMKKKVEFQQLFIILKGFAELLN